MSGRRNRGPGEAGQIIVLFSLAFAVMTAMVGLVLDAGSTFAQRRSQQNAADVAALAGANDYLLNRDEAGAIGRARAVAAANGYADGSNGVSVTVRIDTTNGASVKVDIEAVHRNGFASVVGMTTGRWGTTATALTGFPDSAIAAAPMLFDEGAFENGEPLPAYGDPDHPFTFGEANGDVPTDAGDISWTNYGTGNVDTNVVRMIIRGDITVSPTFTFGTYIGQHNNGYHTALFDDVDTYLRGKDVSVPIVDDAGNYQGWATFHVVSAASGSSKAVIGYFKSHFAAQLLTVGSCSSGDCPRYFGSYVLKLTN